MTTVFRMIKVIGNDVEVLPSILHQLKIAWKSKACSKYCRMLRTYIEL